MVDTQNVTEGSQAIQELESYQWQPMDGEQEVNNLYALS